MANVRISQIDDDVTLTGTEKLTGIDGSDNINITIQQIADFVIAQIGGGGGDTLIMAASGDDLILAGSGDSLILA